MDERAQNRAYFTEKVGTLFEEMLTELCEQKPRDPPAFLLQWLRARNGPPLTQAEKEELERLRQQQSALRAEEQRSDESQESDEDEYVDDVKAAKSGQRKEVSSEVFGQFNKKEDFIPRSIPKTPEQRQRILERLSKAFMFAALDQQETEIVVDAIEEKHYMEGETVISQGDDGDVLYIVDSGTLDCFKVFGKADAPTFLKAYGAGDSFGELALLYNAPRAASIIAKSDATLWALDRACFTHIVKDSAIRKRERYEEFLKNVEILSSMDPYERSQLADAFKTASFQDGELVLREGDLGDVFFIIEEGGAVATKSVNPGEEPVVVKEYGPGDYFGELALLRGEPRAANVIAVGALQCVTLDRHSFKRMLGPLEDILKRNSAKYEEILANLRSA